MNLSLLVALSCVVAGFLMIILGFILTWKEVLIRTGVEKALKKASDESPKPGMGYSAEQQAAVAGASDYVKNLAELAKNLAGLSPAIAAFVISTILFFIAAALSAVDHIVK